MLPPPTRRRPDLRTIGTRLLIAVSVPALLLALLGTVTAWRRTDRAVREKTRTDAMGLAEFVATSFGAVEETPPGTAPRVAHRAVTNAVRSNWSALKLVTDLRIVGRDGQVKWSRRIEEEDKTWAGRHAAAGDRRGPGHLRGPLQPLPLEPGRRRRGDLPARRRRLRRLSHRPLHAAHRRAAAHHRRARAAHRGGAGLHQRHLVHHPVRADQPLHQRTKVKTKNEIGIVDDRIAFINGNLVIQHFFTAGHPVEKGRPVGW